MRAGDFLLGTDVIRQLNYHRRICHLAEKELNDLQANKLRIILEYATETCDFYKPFSTYNHFDCHEWLRRFPVIGKAEINNHLTDFISSKYKIEKLIRCDSSGSSGIRSTVYIDKREQSITRAITILWWEWNGYYLGKPLLQTGMTTKRGFIKAIKDFVLGTKYLNAFHLSENEVLDMLSSIRGKKNYHLFGYASSLYEIAKISLKNNIGVNFDLAMSQGDKLFDHYSKTISAAFNCKVVEDYGMTEGFMVGQKVDLLYFYIYTPNIYIEVLSEHDEPVNVGETGRIILTKLDGFAMPLIRYDTGDLGVLLPKEKYPVHRKFNFPLLERVIGRNTDIIKTNDGKTLIVHTFTGIFEFYNEIKQFQVIQNNINNIIIKYVPDSSFLPEVLMRIENEIREKTRSNIAVIWEKVENIPPSSSGKPQIVINQLLSKSLSEIV